MTKDATNPGDPSPGEEQPADGGRLAPAAGQAAPAHPRRAPRSTRRSAEVRSIAVVHEDHLSHAPEEIVDFDDIADRVAMMAGEVSAAEVPGDPEDNQVVRPVVRGGGDPALALVLTELLQGRAAARLLPSASHGRGHRPQRARGHRGA